MTHDLAWSEHQPSQPDGVAGGGDGDGARGGGEPDDECEHSVQAEHWPLDQAHLVPQSLAFFGHQDLQSPEENTSSLETSEVAGAVFRGTENIAERRASIVALRAKAK